jgi:NADPH:quinone reductase-like Zn-dependent oxidoreductase
VVTAIGDGVDGFEIGDEVLGFSWRRSSHPPPPRSRRAN